MAQKNATSREFAEIVYASVTESAANTLTFQKMETGHGVLDKKAWIIHRLEFYLSATDINRLGAADDVISIALTTSNLISSLDLSSAAVIDVIEFNQLQATAVGFTLFDKPWIRSFTDLPGGGRLVLPNPLYLAVKGTSLAAAVTAKVRIVFTAMDMETDDWLQIVEQTRLLT